MQYPISPLNLNLYASKRPSLPLLTRTIGFSDDSISTLPPISSSPVYSYALAVILAIGNIAKTVTSEMITAVSFLRIFIIKFFSPFNEIVCIVRGGGLLLILVLLSDFLV